MSEAAAKDTGRTRLFRGRLCPVVRSLRNLNTVANYDLISYTRQGTNSRDGSVTTETLTRKLRRPGTGVSLLGKEVEIEAVAAEVELGQ